MSFLGGPECSTAGNPLTQFTKHVQDDKSLQRDRLVGRGPGGHFEGLRSQRSMGSQDKVRRYYIAPRRIFDMHLGSCTNTQIDDGRIHATEWGFVAGSRPTLCNGADAKRNRSLLRHGFENRISCVGRRIRSYRTSEDGSSISRPQNRRFRPCWI